MWPAGVTIGALDGSRGGGSKSNNIEVAKEKTGDVVASALDKGFDRIWIHQTTETPEAVELAASRGASVHTGSRAVMYLAPTMSPHAVHRGMWKLIGRF